jgi:HPt (histidine-containing phosphotransfer) domain-containing protein
MEAGAVPAPGDVRQSNVWSLPDELLQLARDGAADLVADVIAVYLADSATRLANLAQAVEAGNWKQIRAEGHALKGSSLQVGAEAMAGICLQLEHMKSESIPEAAQLLHRLQGIFAEVEQAMSHLNLEEESNG